MLSVRVGFIFAVVVIIIIYTQKKSNPKTHAIVPYCWEKVKGNHNGYYFVLDQGLVLFPLHISKVKEVCNKLSCLTISVLYWWICLWVGKYSINYFIKNLLSLKIEIMKAKNKKTSHTNATLSNTTSTLIKQFWTKHYNTHNQAKTIDINEAYKFYIPNILMDNTTDSKGFIHLLKLHGVKTS